MMSPIEPAVESVQGRPRGFILYVEGPRDRAILRAWAYRLLPSVSRQLFGASVILGGRRPARAVEHFRGAGGAEAGLLGLCVLDRDAGVEPAQPTSTELGLEFFTWGRRHIESYLLVPAAIHRTLRLADDDRRIHRALDEVLPQPADESAYRHVDAKRLLGPKGALPRALGRSIPLQRVARATRQEELHPDVHLLFDRLRDGLGVTRPASGWSRA
jgi:hypothetical protein